MRNVNLAVRFLLELTGVGVLAHWGYHVPSSQGAAVALAIGAPMLLVAVWARVVAPKATNGLAPLTRMLIGSALLLICAAALATTSTGWATTFAAINVVNTIVLASVGPPTTAG